MNIENVPIPSELIQVAASLGACHEALDWLRAEQRTFGQLLRYNARWFGWANRNDLVPLNLRCIDLRGANLSNANLRGADLRGSNLSDAYLVGTDLRGADLRDADLSCANLNGAELGGADLSDAYLRDGELSHRRKK